MQRVTAVALVLLGSWFLVSFAMLDDYSLAAVTAWVQQPMNAIVLILGSVTLTYHSLLGIQVVIEDYVHGPALKVVSLLASKFVHIFLGLAAVLAVLNVALGGAL
jgi:succinate dehydrogenase / fumarate reductase membrane anchor subunit